MKKRLILLLLVGVLFLAACGENPAATEEAGVQTPVAGTPEEGPAKCCFDLTEGEEKYLEGQSFPEDVVINGENAAITFEGCEFSGDVILTGAVGTRAVLINCTVAGNCVFDNGVKEGTMETVFPKIITTGSVDVIAEDCYGSAIALGDFEITYNGKTYSMADSELFYDNSDPEAEAALVPYEGQQANLFYVGQWWENGEQILFLECEYDPSM